MAINIEQEAPLNKDLLKGVKLKLRIDVEDKAQDERIQEEIKDLIVEVLEICELKELPKALEPFIKRKVVSYIKSGMTGVTGEWDEQVKSVSRGDTTITMLSTKERFTPEELNLIEKFKHKKVIVR